MIKRGAMPGVKATPVTDRLAELKEQWTQAKKAAGWKPQPKPRATTFVKSLINDLETAYQATFDPIFNDAAEALGSSGLQGYAHTVGLYSADDLTFLGDPESLVLAMSLELEKGRLSVNAAAAEIAVKLRIFGSTFEAVVEDLRKLYAKKVGQPIPDRRGSVGYDIFAVPLIEDVFMEEIEVGVEETLDRVTNGGRPTLPQEGAIVPYTAYWRKRFENGDISIRRVVPDLVETEPDSNQPGLNLSER